jgi:hypothetical protein
LTDQVQVQIKYESRPSTAAYMLRALLPSPGLKQGCPLPAIRADWCGLQLGKDEIDDFLRLTGLPRTQSMSILHPHVFGFRLLMAILTHPAYPLPIWGALQIRNQLLLHRPIPANERFDLASQIAGHRVLDKGVEIDIHSALRCAGEMLWESLNTFYYRGRFGAPGPPSPLASAPEVADNVATTWRTASGMGRRFGQLTGDYNGIHLWNWYARLFGFRGAFHHPQLILGQCLARLPPAVGQEPQRVRSWLKGPVYYDSDVVLRAQSDGGATTFALSVGGDPRPAIVGHWAACNPAAGFA